jgi:hypothetical protein
MKSPVGSFNLVSGEPLDLLNQFVSVAFAVSEQRQDQSLGRSGHKFSINHSETIHCDDMYVKREKRIVYESREVKRAEPESDLNPARLPIPSRG